MQWTQKALDRFPDDDRLYNLSANIKLKLNRKNEALADIEKAILLADEDKPDYHLAKARILIQLQRNDEAETELELAPDLPKARQLLIALKSRNQPPVNNSARDQMLQNATELAKQGRTAEAIPLFDQIIKDDPKNKTAYLNRGSAYGQSGEFEKALGDFKSALALDPGAARTYYLLGVTYRDMGNKNLACEHYGRAAGLGWQLDQETINYCRN